MSARLRRVPVASWIWLVLAVPAVASAGADTADATAPQFTLQSMVTGLDPGTGRDGVTYALTTHAGDHRVRFDLPRPDGTVVRLLVDRRSGEGWVFDGSERAGLPVKVEAVRQLVVDPAMPCAQMRVTCHREPDKSIAGVQAQGWRYAGAGQRGPGGTHAGTLWLDPASGILLGYEARTRSRAERRMRAMSLQLEPVAAEVLQLPDALRDR